MQPAAAPPPQDRSQYLQQFLDGGFISDAQGLERLDQAEFESLVQALSFSAQDQVVYPAEMIEAETRVLIRPPEKTLEERIAALKVPKDVANVIDEFEIGQSIMRGNLEIYNVEVKSKVNDLTMLIQSHRR
jgi:hypothetical protein